MSVIELALVVLAWSGVAFLGLWLVADDRARRLRAENERLRAEVGAAWAQVRLWERVVEGLCSGGETRGNHSEDPQCTN